MAAHSRIAEGARLWVWLAILLVVSALLPTSASAQSGGRSITLFDLHQGDTLSDMALAFSTEGYFLQGDNGSVGPWQSMAPFYATHWREVTARSLLTLDADHGVVFGLTTGEAGEKYKIDPSIILAFIDQMHPRLNATLTIQAGTSFFGHMTEYPCVGDFGDVGSSITVNCRLAASQINTEESLKYLVNQDPSRLSLTVSYVGNF